MNMDPIMPILALSALIVVGMGLVLRLMKQPSVVAYILVGILLGPHGVNLIQDQVALSRMGEIGVVFLLFFVGSEISLATLITRWRVAVIGTLFQILFSIACIWGIGMWLDWSNSLIVLLGFVISLSSTAVVIKLLEEWGETETEVGKDVIGVLLTQDLAVIPMLIVINLMRGEKPSIMEITIQVLGGLGILAFVAWIYWRGQIKIPFVKAARQDHELQVFVALVLCFGCAALTGFLGLSTAFGAFIGGMIISVAKETQWVHSSLHAFRVVFMAVFFVSIGMLVNLQFVAQNWKLVVFLAIVTILINTSINTLTLRMLQAPWKHSLYAGSLLSQVGEFSFVLVAVGFQAGLINEFGYQTAISVMAFTLILSPFWILLIKRVSKIRTPNTLLRSPHE